ncbi:sugar phosphate isomerase/epimerase [Frigoribacterium endophyticum]|nr:sugar phosphate isomerase/epimerase [Frigoribacterium endophyticum]
MITVGMSTSCVFPRPADEAFRLARRVGYGGVEVMVTADRGSRDASLLRASVARWGLPVLSVHAPVLPAAHFALGRDQRDKLLRSAELAAELGAPTVVVHPPFRWQRRIAARFVEVVRDVEAATGVELAVENMFPWRLGPVVADVYSPGHDPVGLDVAATTLDFSHAAVAGRDALDLALALGPRLRHVHLCDGTVSARPGGLVDEHLVPGTGTQPVAEVLSHLAASGWSGAVVAEVHADRRGAGEESLVDALRRTLSFAREALRAPRAAVGQATSTVATTASGTATTATTRPPSTMRPQATSTPMDVSRPCQSSVASEAQGATRQPTLTPISTATSRSGDPATGSSAR